MTLVDRFQNNISWSNLMIKSRAHTSNGTERAFHLSPVTILLFFVLIHFYLLLVYREEMYEPF